MNITEKKIVTNDFMYRDSHYTLFYFPEIKKYGAIDHKYIEDGKLTRVLNGLQLLLNDSIPAVIEGIKAIEDMNHYMNQGYTRYQAMCIVYKLKYHPEYEAIFQ